MKEAGNPIEAPSRRSFFRKLVLAAGGAYWGLSRRDTAEATMDLGSVDRSRVRALLVSATTLQGRGSLEHAVPYLKDNYGNSRNILLLNFASLPEDRDAYESRMQRDFARIDSAFQVRSLHRAKETEVATWIREAEGFFASGGNTFLLLRALYDRFAVELLRERVLNGVPYAGSSAGSNIGGIEIGTTNDFPICDVPTRRSLGLFDGLYNPHHPEASEEKDFASRQWKINQFCRLRPEALVVGVTNPGMLEIRGTQIQIKGEGGSAFLQRGERKVAVLAEQGGDLSEAL